MIDAQARKVCNQVTVPANEAIEASRKAFFTDANAQWEMQCRVLAGLGLKPPAKQDLRGLAGSDKFEVFVVPPNVFDKKPSLLYRFISWIVRLFKDD